MATRSRVRQGGGDQNLLPLSGARLAKYRIEARVKLGSSYGALTLFISSSFGFHIVQDFNGFGAD